MLSFTLNKKLINPFLVTCLLGMLNACSVSPPLKPAKDPSLSYHFKGFSLSPPAADNWSRSETDVARAVFYKTLEKTQFFQLSAVVTPFQSNATHKANEAFETFIDHALLDKYQHKTELTLLNLRVKPLTLHNAQCAEFVAEQGKRYFPPLLEAKIEYIHRGYVCQHPSLPLLIQGVATEHRLQGSDLELDEKLVEDAQNLIRSIQFTTP